MIEIPRLDPFEQAIYSLVGEYRPAAEVIEELRARVAPELASLRAERDALRGALEELEAEAKDALIDRIDDRDTGIPWAEGVKHAVDTLRTTLSAHNPPDGGKEA